MVGISPSEGPPWLRGNGGTTKPRPQGVEARPNSSLPRDQPFSKEMEGPPEATHSAALRSSSAASGAFLGASPQTPTPAGGKPPFGALQYRFCRLELAHAKDMT